MKKNTLFIILILLFTVICSCYQRDTYKIKPNNSSKIATENLNKNKIIDNQIFESEKLTEEEAVTLLYNTLANDKLHFIVTEYDEYMDDEFLCIKAFYDELDHIITEGYYFINKNSHEIYKQNMLGEGQIRIK